MFFSIIKHEWKIIEYFKQWIKPIMISKQNESSLNDENWMKQTGQLLICLGKCILKQQLNLL